MDVLKEMRQRFTMAINQDIYKKWKGNYNGAVDDLQKDKLLKPLWSDPDILNLIKERVSSK